MIRCPIAFFRWLSGRATRAGLGGGGSSKELP